MLFGILLRASFSRSGSSSTRNEFESQSRLLIRWILNLAIGNSYEQRRRVEGSLSFEFRFIYLYESCLGICALENCISINRPMQHAELIISTAGVATQLWGWWFPLAGAKIIANSKQQEKLFKAWRRDFYACANDWVDYRTLSSPLAGTTRHSLKSKSYLVIFLSRFNSVSTNYKAYAILLVHMKYLGCLVMIIFN